ncbi:MULTISPECIES: ABC transporter permease [Streptomyces]|uniref:ABC transporter permease n=1 Tax=Streptomyces TaxID=1883 RepID=UPI0016749A39|nr:MULTISPECIES: ABC transporter permease [Streptomyces]MBD3578399.1 ABC transporter permease [Streptomyces sp. KD18]GGT11078.1 transport permease protein [Streptomyces toxytricini]
MSTATTSKPAAAAAAAAPAGTGPLPGEGRIGLRGNLRHISALARRNVMQLKADPQSMFDVVFMPIVFALLFVFVFGGAISGNGNQDAYVNYVIPGLMAMMGLNVAMGVGVGVNDDFKKGVMDRFRSMPIARSSVLLAKIVVELGRTLIAITILLGVGFLLGLSIETSFTDLLLAIGLSAVFGASLMWIFILLGLTLQNAQAVQGVAMMVLMPLQFGSSIFAPPSTMPGWLQSFTDYNPLSQLADAARGLINGGPVAHAVWVTLAWSLAITVVTMPLAVRKFRQKT